MCRKSEHEPEAEQQAGAHFEKPTGSQIAHCPGNAVRSSDGLAADGSDPAVSSHQPTSFGLLSLPPHAGAWCNAHPSSRPRAHESGPWVAGDVCTKHTAGDGR